MTIESILAIIGAVSSAATVIGHLCPGTKVGKILLAVGTDIGAILGAVRKSDASK